jgi:hypothetical protein
MAYTSLEAGFSERRPVSHASPRRNITIRAMGFAREYEFAVKRASLAQIELPCSTRPKAIFHDPAIRANLIAGRRPL